MGDGEVAPSHWFEAIAEHTGAAYLRYSFTKGTVQEVDFLVDVLGLEPGMRVLDVGCGPGRHSHELERRGIRAHGIDISERFVELARAGSGTFERGDVRDLAYDREFDAVICLCQGGFGLLQGDESLEPLARAVKPGGRIACSAFSAYFQVRFLDDSTFDADTGVNHERTVVKDEDGNDAEFDLWTTCFTPRELRLLAGAAGLEMQHVYSVGPGDYARRAPTIDSYEYLVVASRPN